MLKVGRILATLLISGLLATDVVFGDTVKPANVILFIGDGMDEHQITMARNYLLGPEEGLLAMEQLPVRSSARVQTLLENRPDRFTFIADSANSASTLATGQLTSAGRIATSAGTDFDQPTILQAARESGFLTGLVTTASLTDATPAAFVAHTAHRNCQGPEDMNRAISYAPPSQQCAIDSKQQGGPGSIAEQLIDARVDVLLGGGKKYFAQKNHVGVQLLDQARSQGYQLIDHIGQGEASDQPRLLGLFSPGHLPVEWIGSGNRRAEAVELASAKPVFAAPFDCRKNPRHNGTPTLAKMTQKALARLSRNPSRGFFLMVEGASIDKQAHRRNPCGQIGELSALDSAVAVGREFAKQHPGTLIIVTADHGQAGQILPLPDNYRALTESLKSPQYPPGYYAVLKTRHGELMAVGYASNAPPHGGWEQHTGVDVPMFLEGIDGREVPASMSQRDIFRLMRAHLQLP